MGDDRLRINRGLLLEKNRIERIDNMLKPDNTYNWNGVVVNEFLLTKHNDNGISLPSGEIKVESITIHNTPDLVGVYDDAEQYTRATYNGNMGDVVVTMYVDDVNAWLNMPLTSPTYHSATTKGNYSSISIECIMDGQTGTENERAEDNCARLTAYLLKKFNLTIDDVRTHKDWNGKQCPVYILPHWNNFLQKVNKYLGVPANITADTQVEQMYRIRKEWTDVKSQIGAYRSLDGAINACTDGYAVFDIHGTQVYPIVGNSVKQNSVELLTAKKGDRTRQVLTLQALLSGFGYQEVGSIDGIFGDNTEKAVRRYQSDNKLTIDGIVGLATWTKLLRG